MIRSIATEMYKVYHNLSPLFIGELFNEKTVHHNTRSNLSIKIDNDNNVHCNKKASFKTPKVKTTRFGIETIKWMGPHYLEFYT